MKLSDLFKIEYPKTLIFGLIPIKRQRIRKRSGINHGVHRINNFI